MSAGRRRTGTPRKTRSVCRSLNRLNGSMITRQDNSTIAGAVTVQARGVQDELAAKDLTDLVELLRASEGRVEATLAEAPPAVVPTLRRVWQNVRG